MTVPTVPAFSRELLLFRKNCSLWFTFLISFVNDREICGFFKIAPLENYVYIVIKSHDIIESFCWIRLHDPLYYVIR